LFGFVSQFGSSVNGVQDILWMGCNPNSCDLKSLLMIWYSKTHVCYNFICYVRFLVDFIGFGFLFYGLIFICCCKWIIFWITKNLYLIVLHAMTRLVLFYALGLESYVLNRDLFVWEFARMLCGMFKCFYLWSCNG